MKICLDTNALIQALAAGHPYNAILAAWMRGEFTWAVSTSIMLEYEEVITRMAGTGRWVKFLRLLELAQMAGGLLEHATTYFHFQVITADPDDNIFTDCAIASHADYVVTEDRHFAPLVTAGYHPKPIAPREFLAKLSA